MEQCPTLPVTGVDVTGTVVAAVVIVTLGILTLIMARRHALPLLAIMILGVAMGEVVTAHAATGCTPTSVATTPAPTVTPPSTVTRPSTVTSPPDASNPPTTAPSITSAPSTSPTTTSTGPATTTTTTLAGTPPSAADEHLGVVTGGQPVNFNVLANDFLGDPPATGIDSSTLANGDCSGLSLDALTGELSGTAAAPASPVVCDFFYTISNPLGSSQAHVALVILPIPASTTTTTLPIAPNAVDDSVVATPGASVSLNLLANDDLGSPPATITDSSGFTVGGCAALSFDQATGVISGTFPGGACFASYRISNAAGSDLAMVTIVVA